MTAREAAHRYGAIDQRAAAGFPTALLHHRMGHGLEGETLRHLIGAIAVRIG